MSTINDIVRDATKHLPHYLSLIGIIIIGLIGHMLFSYDKVFQSIIAISTGIAYTAWGIVHHWLHEELDFKIFLEYLFTALFGITILLSLIW